jgi:8-oxo-dGTP pyrophosphatase MutT (NUDIX family)
LTTETETSGFQRHIRRCNNAVLPGERLPFLIGEAPVGWVRPAFAQALAGFAEFAKVGGKVVLQEAGALQNVARILAEQGHYRWRNEAFDVRATPDGPALAQLDRGAIPSFGVVATGVHLNGLVQRGDGLHVWIARRAADKLLDPGKLDHITAGGVPAGLTPEQTLVKEAAEEAAIPAALASQAHRVATIGYAMERPEGLRRDLLQCYDLTLAEDFIPRAADGEVEAFELWPLARVVAAVRDTDTFKFNVNLVLIDLFLRHGLIPDAEAATLRAALRAGHA